MPQKSNNRSLLDRVKQFTLETLAAFSISTVMKAAMVP